MLCILPYSFDICFAALQIVCPPELAVDCGTERTSFGAVTFAMGSWGCLTYGMDDEWPPGPITFPWEGGAFTFAHYVEAFGRVQQRLIQ